MKKIAITALTMAISAMAVAQNTTQQNNDTIMSDKTVDLNNVEIVAQKPLVKMKTDKVTYAVKDDADAQTLTLLDMLRKVPMVTVDGQDNISVNGSSSFKVYTNGKPNPMFSSNSSQIFRSIPASMVDHIEVVTNPGAKYDAEGTSGILDIHFKTQGGGGAAAKSPDGYNGSLEARGGNKGFGASAFISGQKNKVTYSANVSYDYQDNGDVDVSMSRVQNDGSTMDYSLTTRNKVPVIVGNFGLGYEIDSLNSINASLGMFNYRVKNNGTPVTSLHGGAYGQGFSYTNSYNTKMGATSVNGSLDYQHFFDAKHKNSLTLTYQFNTEPSINNSETKFIGQGTSSTGSGIDLTDRRSDGDLCTTEHVAQADLTYKLSYNTTLNTGIKYANRRNTAVSDYYTAGTYSDALSSDYVYKNNIGAAYAELDNNWSSWSLKAGLRYEHTWQNIEYRKGQGSDFSKNYGNLVPSANISYVLAPGQNIGLAYNMRISRPGISYLNPYVDRSEPTSISYGNSNLDVEKNNTVSLVYNIYSQKVIINTTLKQQFINGGIEEYHFFSGNILNTTYGNIVDRRITSLDIFASCLLHKNTRLTVKAGGSYSDFRSTELDQYNHGWAGNAMLNLQQTLPKDMTCGLTFMMNSKSYDLQGWNSGFNIAVLTFSKSLLKKRLMLSMNALTGFNKGGKINIDRYAAGKDFSTTTNISVPLARISLTARWTFGNTAKKYEVFKNNIESDYIEHKSDNTSYGSDQTQGM